MPESRTRTLGTILPEKVTNSTGGQYIPGHEKCTGTIVVAVLRRNARKTPDGAGTDSDAKYA